MVIANFLMVISLYNGLVKKKNNKEVPINILESGLANVKAYSKAIDELGKTILHRAASPSGNINVLKPWLEKNVNINATDKSGRTPLHLAIDSIADIDIIKTLLQNNANSSPAKSVFTNEFGYYHAYFHKGNYTLTQNTAASTAILGIHARENLGIRDGFFRNDEESQPFIPR